MSGIELSTVRVPTGITKRIARSDDDGVLEVALPYTIAGEDIDNDVLKVETRYSFVNITTQTTTVVKSGIGVLKRITFNRPLANGVVTLYNNTAASGELIGTITFPATLLSDIKDRVYEAEFDTGLTIVTSGATQDITVIYR